MEVFGNRAESGEADRGRGHAGDRVAIAQVTDGSMIKSCRGETRFELAVI